MGERIKRVRKDVKMNQTDFGQSLGVSQYTVSSFETGRAVPDESIIKLICSIYNVNEAWLRTGEGDPYKKQLLPAL